MNAKLVRAGYTLLDTILWGSLGVLVLIFARPGLYLDVVNDPHLVVRELTYVDGLFYQRVVPDQAGGAINAEWAAQIETSEGEFVCGGGDTSTYQNRDRPLIMSPNEWTGDTCNLVPGQEYTAKASWEYFNTRGLIQRRSAELQFTYQGEQ